MASFNQVLQENRKRNRQRENPAYSTFFFSLGWFHPHKGEWLHSAHSFKCLPSPPRNTLTDTPRQYLTRYLGILLELQVNTTISQAFSPARRKSHKTWNLDGACFSLSCNLASEVAPAYLSHLEVSTCIEPHPDLCALLTNFCVLRCFSRVRLFATPWTTAHRAPLSMGFSRQEY